MEVPQDYFGEYAEPGKQLRVRVRRICRGEAKYYLWIIPGGPGGHSNAVEQDYTEIAEYLPEDGCVCFMDHRGTGKSGKYYFLRVHHF